LPQGHDKTKLDDSIKSRFPEFHERMKRLCDEDLGKPVSLDLITMHDQSPKLNASRNIHFQLFGSHEIPAQQDD